MSLNLAAPLDARERVPLLLGDAVAAVAGIGAEFESFGDGAAQRKSRGTNRKPAVATGSRRRIAEQGEESATATATKLTLQPSIGFAVGRAL